jgi:hypothetical protein
MNPIANASTLLASRFKGMVDDPRVVCTIKRMAVAARQPPDACESKLHKKDVAAQSSDQSLPHPSPLNPSHGSA